MNTAIVTFSPTGTSSAIAQAISRGINPGEMKTIDVTRGEAVTKEFDSDTVVVVSVPVYGGHVAPPALQRLEHISGNNTPAVAVVVYGNRHYEADLDQLAEFLGNRGFRVIAAGTFIGEHSYSTAETPIATGRPDAEDLRFAEQFGKAVGQKLSTAPNAPAIDVSSIEKPVQDAEVMVSFQQTVMGWMQQGVPIPSAPQVDTNLCTGCGTCVDCCPTHAIPANSPSTTDAGVCIKCCACVKACPTGARTFPTPFAALLTKKFAEPKENKTLL